MQQVWPPGVAITPAPAADESAEVQFGLTPDQVQQLYRMPDGPGLFVRTTFVSSLDGSVQGPDGRSGTINTPSDVALFGWLRALSNLVLVGAGTVRAEGYRAIRLTEEQHAVRAAAGLEGVPTLVVVSRSLKLDPAIAHSGGAGTDDGIDGQVMVVTGAAGDDADLVDAGVEIMRAPGPGGVDLRRALGWLSDRGLSRVVCEGGPSLHRQLIADQLVDEVCLTLVGDVVGGFGPRLVDGPPVSASFGLAHLLIDDDGTLFGRWRRTAGAGPWADGVSRRVSRRVS